MGQIGGLGSLLYTVISVIAGTYNGCKLRIHVINKVVLNLDQDSVRQVSIKSEKSEQETDRVPIESLGFPNSKAKNFDALAIKFSEVPKLVLYMCLSKIG